MVELEFVAPSFLQDPDTFWHIKDGEWIIDHGRVLLTDVFSYTAAGNPWANTAWLSDILYALVFRLAGFKGIALQAIASTALVMTILFGFLLGRIRFSVAVGWAAITCFATSPHFLARPHLFSYIVMTFWLIILMDADDRNDLAWRRTIQLALLMVLWANIHGGFTLGLIFLYTFAGVLIVRNYMVSDRPKCLRIAAASIIITAASMITPSGYLMIRATVDSLQNKKTLANIGDAMPPNFQVEHLKLLLFAGFLTVLLGLGVRLRGARLLAFFGLLMMALAYARGLVIFYLLAPILLAPSLSETNKFFAPTALDAIGHGATRDPVLRFLRASIVNVVSVSIILWMGSTAFLFLRTDIEPSNKIAPRAALEYARTAHLTGNVLNDYNFGGYLIASGVPTFIDGRVLPFDKAFLDRYFDAVDVVDLKQALKLLDQYNVQWTLLVPTRPLAKALAQSQDWKQVYSDKFAVISVREPR
jgi:hypothetical protein